MKIIYKVSFFITFLFSYVNNEFDIQPVFDINCIFCHQNVGSVTFNLA